MICVCGKKMTETEQSVETEIGDMASGYKTEDGFLCECGLFLCTWGAVWKDKTYPYWKYDSDNLKKIMGIKE